MSNKQTHQYQPNPPIQHSVYVNNQSRAGVPNANYPPELLARFQQDPRANIQRLQTQYVQIPTHVVTQGQKPPHGQTTLQQMQPPQMYVEGHIANMHPNMQHHQLQLQYPGQRIQGHAIHHTYAFPAQSQHVVGHGLMGFRPEPFFYPPQQQQQQQTSQISLQREGAAAPVPSDPKHLQPLQNVPPSVREQYPQQPQMQATMYSLQPQQDIYPPVNSASYDTSKSKVKKRPRQPLTIVHPDTQQIVTIDDQSELNANSERETSADKSSVCATFAAQVAAKAAEPSAPKSTNDKTQVTSKNPANVDSEGLEFGAGNEEKSQASNCNPEVAANFKALVSAKLGLARSSEPVPEVDSKILLNPDNKQVVDYINNDKSCSKENSPPVVCNVEPVIVETKTQTASEPLPEAMTKVAEKPQESCFRNELSGSREVNPAEIESQSCRTEVDFVKSAEEDSIKNQKHASEFPLLKNPSIDEKISVETVVKPEEVVPKPTEEFHKIPETRNSQKRNRHNRNVAKNSESNRKVSEKEEVESPSSNLVQSVVSEKSEAKPDVTPPSQEVIKEESGEIKNEIIKNEKECEKKIVVSDVVVEKPIETSNNNADDTTSKISAEEKEVEEKNKQNKEESMSMAKVSSNEITNSLKKVDNESIAPAEPSVKEENDKNTNSDGTTAKVAPPPLKYEYQDGQWSPLNTAGKKVYGREFLMNLQHDPSSKVKPSNLPDLDVVLNNCVVNQNVMDFRVKDHQHRDILLPGFVRGMNTKMPTPKRGGGGGGGQHSDKQIKSNKQPSIIHVSLRTDVKLRETENAWKPKRAAPASNSEEEKTENLYKKVRSVLNKLTPQKFETLVNQVRELEIDTEERLQGVIDLVFKKAVDEPNFSVAYALMCKELSNIAVANATEASSANFRKLLINRCQSEFEKNTVDETARAEKLKVIQECTDPEKKKELQANLEEEERILRVRSVGNIRFIGELFKQNMLTCKIMDQCIRHLLLQVDEENLECLCKLLTTVGKVLESKKVDLSAYFKKMQNLTTQKGKVSSRIRFMLLDVIDLRANNWVPRRDDSNPKTMDQIQKDVETETMNIEINNSIMNTPRKDDRGMDKRGGGGGNRNNNRGGGGRPSEEPGGWSSMPSKNTRTVYTVETSKLKSKLPAMDDLQLGSRTNYQWSMPKAPATVTTPNKFAFLAQDMSEPKEQRPTVTNYSSSRSMDARRDFSRDYNKGTNYDSRNSRNSNYQSSSRSHSKQRERSAEKSELQSSVPATKNTAQIPEAAPKEIPLDKLERLVKNYVEEFVLEDGESMNQAVESFRNTFPVSSHTVFSTEIVNILLTKSKDHQLKASKILSQLLSQKSLSVEHLNAALKDLIEMCEDVLIDIPRLWEYLAKILLHPAISNTEFLTGLKNLLQPPQETFLVFVAELMSEINKLQGPQITVDIWKKSELKWTDFSDNQEKIEKNIKQRELDFIL